MFLILFLVSAYSLNRNLNVFEDSADWLCGMLILSCINCCLFVFYDYMPRQVQLITLFILGISVILFLYLSIYLLPLYFMSAVCSIALGLSLHTFVPLLFTITSVRLAIRKWKISAANGYTFLTGMISSVIVIVVFSVSWFSVNRSINRSYYRGVAAGNDLPGWINTAIHLPPGNMVEKILKSGIVYTTAKTGWTGMFWSMLSRTFEEKSKHDPLIMTASYFSPPADIDENEKLKILRLQLDARHKTQDRLWNGDDLQTRNINTNVRIWPRLHIAYTEKIITVRNNIDEEHHSWNNEEAIYTFHLPEGSVVTSLSLWINGVEEKSVLTTKEKADTAYKTIVGVQARDPSVVHWKEGNTVSVRVFPVVAGETRIFKLGITTPLIQHENRIAYRNIYFDGPATKNTTEDIHLMFEDKVKDMQSAIGLQSNDGKQYTFSGNYNPGWELSWLADTLQPASFSFNNNSYTISPYKPERLPADIQNIYLDINRTWNTEEINNMLSLPRKYHLFVYNNELTELDNSNKTIICEELRKQQFSLFPVYLIKDPEHSLLVSKSSEQSATLEDLKGSSFYTQLTQMPHDRKIMLFNIGDGLSYYLRSLREMRWLRYEQGSISTLNNLLTAKTFASDNETDSSIVIHDAGITITQSAGNTTTQAPDHLMRLFAYNHIMQQGGSKLLNGNIPEEDTLVQEAKAAHIVSPLSSMIVLESAKDYKDFNIEASKNSLQNASIKSNGSVPEPHEWALIILAVGFIIYLKRKQKSSCTVQ